MRAPRGLAVGPPLEAVFDAVRQPRAYGRLDAQVLGLPRSEPRAVEGLEGLAYGRLDAQVLASAWRASLTCAGPSTGSEETRISAASTDPSSSPSMIAAVQSASLKGDNT